MARCFNNGKPNLAMSDKIYNTKTKTIFYHNKNQFNLGKLSNHNKSICYDSNGIKKTSNYNQLLSLNYGMFLCENCNTTPPPHTKYGPNMIMNIIEPSSVLINLSLNAANNNTNNYYLTDNSSQLLYPYHLASRLDPNNRIVGDITDCNKKNYLNLVDISNNSLNMQYNYLNDFSFPSRITL